MEWCDPLVGLGAWGGLGNHFEHDDRMILLCVVIFEIPFDQTEWDCLYSSSNSCVFNKFASDSHNASEIGYLLR